MIKIVIVLTVAYLTDPGQITERSEEIVLGKAYASTSECRAALRNDDDVYRAMRRAVGDLRVLVNAQLSRKPVVKIGERAYCSLRP